MFEGAPFKSNHTADYGKSLLLAWSRMVLWGLKAGVICRQSSKGRFNSQIITAFYCFFSPVECFKKNSATSFNDYFRQILTLLNP